MKKQLLLILIFVMLSYSVRSIIAGTPEKSVVSQSQNNINADSTAAHVSFGAIKINPIQLLFNEIPVSFEMDLQHERSVQFQVGFIFPSAKKYILRNLFESNGTNADASSKGLLSYRQSPYNNYGFSFKLEFRKYGRYFYSGPQLMYKNSFYKNVVFEVYGGGITLNQTESKFSNIFGIGYVLGHQNDSGDLVYDWYGSVGFRVRSMAVTIYSNSKETITSFYPFINLGLRI